MNQPSKILVPIDLSPLSLKALEYAAILSTALDASLVLCTNLTLPEIEELELFDPKLTVVEAGHAKLRRLAGRLAPGVDIETTVTERDFPTDGVLDAAELNKVDLIVMASHGRTGFRRLVLGSVAENVARATSVPVVIVPIHDT